MDRLQASDIERSRSELADLERRFLERVAITIGKPGGGTGTSDVTLARAHTSCLLRHWFVVDLCVLRDRFCH